MIKTLARLVGALFLLTLTVNGIAQSKTNPKSTPAFKKPKPIANVEVKEEPEAPPVEPKQTAIPPLPKIDTVPPPNDEFTSEIKKLMVATNGLVASKTLMAGMLTTQRKNNTSMPDEFYVRMLAAVESGQVTGYIENIIIKIYRQKFTLAEIKEVVKFYDSPVGKKMAAEAPSITDASRIEGEKVGQYVAIKIIEDLAKEGIWK